MSYANGVVYVDTSVTPNVGVSIYDVQRALGVGSDDTYTLATSQNIKLLSKKKPIRGKLGQYESSADVPSELSNTAFMQRDMGFKLPKFNGSDLISYVKNIMQWSTSSLTGRGIGNGWLYSNLRSGTDFARLTDFDGYDHKSKNGYEEDVLCCPDDVKELNGTYSSSPKFWTKISPLHPNQFYSLVNGNGYVPAVAFYAPERSQSTVYFYIGDPANSQASRYNGYVWNNSQESESSFLMIPAATFSNYITWLNGITGTTTISVYVFGFFAKYADRGKNNMVSSGATQPNAINDLYPLPGGGYTTIRFAKTGGYVKLYFNTIGSIQTAEQIALGNWMVYFKIASVTNNYDTMTTDYTKYLYNDQIMFTYEIVNGSNVSVWKSWENGISRAYLFSDHGITNIANTTAGQHKTTEVDLDAAFMLPNAQVSSYIVDGNKIQVHLFYPTEGSTQGAMDYMEAGYAWITIGTPSREI